MIQVAVQIKSPHFAAKQMVKQHWIVTITDMLAALIMWLIGCDSLDIIQEITSLYQSHSCTSCTVGNMEG